MTTKKAKRKARHAAQIATLQRRAMELEAQLAFTYYHAHRDLQKAGSVLMTSGVLITMHAIGGRELIKPVVILDGLSDTTIAALRGDIARSWKKATEFSPIAATQDGVS